MRHKTRFYQLASKKAELHQQCLPFKQACLYDEMAQAFRTIIWAAMHVCLRFEMELKDVKMLLK
jgi:hypothetical protein